MLGVTENIKVKNYVPGWLGDLIVVYFRPFRHFFFASLFSGVYSQFFHPPATTHSSRLLWRCTKSKISLSAVNALTSYYLGYLDLDYHRSGSRTVYIYFLGINIFMIQHLFAGQNIQHPKAKLWHFWQVLWPDRACFSLPWCSKTWQTSWGKTLARAQIPPTAPTPRAGSKKLADPAKIEN